MAPAEEAVLVPWLALAISALALVVSALTAWYVHFRKMWLFTTAGVLFLATHRADPSDPYLLEFMTTLSFANQGAQPGRVLGARIRAVRGDGTDDQLAVFGLEGELIGESAKDAFGASSALSAARIDPGVPFIIQGKSAAVKTLQFADEWRSSLDVPARQLRLVLEIHTDRKRKWEHVQAWTLASYTESVGDLFRTMFDQDLTLVNDPEEVTWITSRGD